uniref:Extensin-like n=1 Tax=Crassostrea virginica TaxID=6565 RepID=A0A8B8CSW8_CRAVI|nr:extensin-like [Crassostrea virginica]
MESKALGVCLVLAVLIVTNIPTSEGKWCTKQAVRYGSERYCSKHSWWNWFCLSYGYRRTQSTYTRSECCTGYQGTDCATPICHAGCVKGFLCSAPDVCSPDPNARTTKAPTPRPTTKAPTPRPTTKAPTPQPTTKAPTPQPTTKAPTPQPTTKAPTPQPTTKAPTPQPTTKAPVDSPTTKAKPTKKPTDKPTPKVQTAKPTQAPPNDKTENPNKGGKNKS